MSLNNVLVGKLLFDDIYVVIEIFVNVDLIKYEVDKEFGVVFVDCFMLVFMFYLCNYGYVNYILLLDGDLVDVLVLILYFLILGFVICCCFVGVLKMMDEFGEDVKVVVVLYIKIFKEYDYI